MIRRLFIISFCISIGFLSCRKSSEDKNQPGLLLLLQQQQATASSAAASANLGSSGATFSIPVGVAESN